MTPQEEIVYSTVKKGAHTLLAIADALDSPNCNSYSTALRSLVRHGYIKSGNCPSCGKKGYHE